MNLNQCRAQGGKFKDGKCFSEPKSAILSTTKGLIIAALGFVAALAWNEAVQSIFRTIFGESNTVFAKITYAGLVTIVAVFITIYIGKNLEK